MQGWAIPTATDIAFAVAILALISTHLPSGLRTFLLTLAVVDDLIAITIIAVFYTDDLKRVPLPGPPADRRSSPYSSNVGSGRPGCWSRWPWSRGCWSTSPTSTPPSPAWSLAFTVPVKRADGGDGRGLAEHFEHVVRPISAGVAVPVFAFFAAGVSVGGWHGLAEALGDPIALGIITGLVVGKTVGTAGSAWLLARFTHAPLDDELSWVDVVGMAMLAGVGFTVSLLIGELAYGPGTARDEHAKVGVLVGFAGRRVLAAVVLRMRNRVYRRICEAEERDDDRDGVPDVFEGGCPSQGPVVCRVRSEDPERARGSAWQPNRPRPTNPRSGDSSPMPSATSGP